MAMDVLGTYISPTRIGGPAARKSKNAASTSPKPYLTLLLVIFAAWKLLLLAVAYASPGQGYDTSTRILFDRYDMPSRSWLNGLVSDLTLRLTRWDAIYFSTSSERGHLYEQEWAFSWFMSRLTALLSSVIPSFLHTSPIVKHALAGVLLSNLSHLGAVIALYALVHDAIPSDSVGRQHIAFIAACLHTVSPAGLFLSSSCGEGPFAFATFLGTWFYVRAQKNSASSSIHTALCTLLAGSCFAVSSLIRSNGLLNGTILLLDAVVHVQRVFVSRSTARIPQLLSTIVAGSLIAVGFALPQVIAYLEYCTPDATRPWCTNVPPSIYSWVQQHYWNVGFLAYWTMNNAPLFLLAAPMVVVLISTGLWGSLRPNQVVAAIHDRESSASRPSEEDKLFTQVLIRLAIPQLILATMAVTSFHVQIINRISSGCALWYILLAIAVCQKRSAYSSDVFSAFGGRKTEVAVRAMVIYAIVQGGLYASFLPPA